MTTEELIKSVDEKLSILVSEREDIRGILFGEDGIVDNVKLIKAELIGNPEFKKEGLIAMVQKHNELYNKMQNMTALSLVILSVGSAAGIAVSWIIHRWEKIKIIFS